MKNQRENLKIDKTDKQIISLLMQDAMMPYTEIAKKLIVSAGTIHVRMKKLTESGVVKGTTANVDISKFGFDLTAYLGVFLEKGSVYEKVIKQLKEIHEVVEAHYTTGSYSIFLKVICRNTEHLREVLGEKIQSVQGVQRTETFISLEESIKRPVKIEYL